MTSRGERAAMTGRRRSRVALVAVLLASVAVVATACSDDPVAGGRDLRIGGGVVHAVDRAPEGNPVGIVLFLHGGSYTSEVWDRTGLIDDVVDAGWRGVAIDLPGSGDSDDTSLDPVEFLGAVVDQLGEPPVIVSPSASGRYSLPFVAAHPGRVRGLVPVAPVGADSFAMPDGAEAPPSVVVWGSEDPVIDPHQAPGLAEALGGRAEVVEGAGHSVYEDHTPAFRTILLRLLRELG